MINKLKEYIIKCDEVSSSNNSFLAKTLLDDIIREFSSSIPNIDDNLWLSMPSDNCTAIEFTLENTIIEKPNDTLHNFSLYLSDIKTVKEKLQTHLENIQP